MISIEAYRAAIGRFYGKWKSYKAKLASRDALEGHYIILLFIAILLLFFPLVVYTVITILMCIIADYVYILKKEK